MAIADWNVIKGLLFKVSKTLDGFRGFLHGKYSQFLIKQNKHSLSLIQQSCQSYDLQGPTENR